jgi:putative hydrolase of the HAD superfamily
LSEYFLTIKAVLFDMGDTLVKYDVDTFEEVFQRVLISLGISRSLDEIKIAFLNSEKEAKDINLLSSFGKIRCEEYWHQWDSLVLKHLKITDNEELARIVQSRWFDFVDSTLYPEVKEVLAELKQRGLKLGLISNGYEEEINLILEQTDLEKTTFDITVGVDTTKNVKPNPDVFKYALKKLDVKAEEAIFVGDNVEVDYKGAENAGLHTLLIDRTEKHRGLRIIRNLKEILSQIN